LLQSIIINEPALQLTDERESNQSALFNSLANKDEKTILIVEDEQSIRYLLKDLLCEYYTVYEAGNGCAALDLLKNVTPDLIICDVMMPDMNGLELCKVIKTTPKTCHIPFVILSAKGTTEQKAEGYEAGADAYIPKPFRTDYLLVRVKKLINYQQRLHELFASHHYAFGLPETGINSTDKKFLEKTIQVIDEHIEVEDMDSAFLEEKLGLSRMQLYRKLKSLCNMTPAELIKNMRLEFAAGLLIKTELSVSEIFYKSGFNNQSYFYREFKKKYTLSPNGYRANFKSPVA
jgi:YesN/AraC family two-component response regulator